MGADWYHFSSITAAAIPVPKEALARSFKLPGLRLMTIDREFYEEDTDRCIHRYYVGLICLGQITMEALVDIEVIGPYNIEQHKVAYRRMKHLDEFLPMEVREKLKCAFEAYVGRKHKEGDGEVPGFWTVGASRSYIVNVHETWDLKEGARIARRTKEEREVFECSMLTDSYDSSESEDDDSSESEDDD